MDLSLYLVTDRTLAKGRNIDFIVKEAVKGGVTMVQLREKEAFTLEFLQLAQLLKKILQQYNVPLIINDRLDIVLASNADGLHIGQNDMPYNIARQLLGKDKIIGISVENINDVFESNKLDVNYIAISPVFSTSTKTDTKQPFGIEGVKTVSSISKHPTVAIGGINISNAGKIIEAGANGIAVVSALMSAENPLTSAKELKNIIRKNVKIKQI